jgi:hypothetical protein
MTPAQVALLVWLFGALATGGWIASLFRSGAMPTVETDDPHHARTFDRGVAFGAVLCAALWPVSLPFFLLSGRRRK